MDAVVTLKGAILKTVTPNEHSVARSTHLDPDFLTAMALDHEFLLLEGCVTHVVHVDNPVLFLLGHQAGTLPREDVGWAFLPWDKGVQRTNLKAVEMAVCEGRRLLLLGRPQLEPTLDNL